MIVKIRRFKEGRFVTDQYQLDVKEPLTVLEILYRIREEHDPTLSFRVMCRASVCGTCGVKVNGKPVLACNTRVKGEEEILIEPLQEVGVLKDLVVDQERLPRTLKSYRLWLVPGDGTTSVSKESLSKTAKAWDCIACDICNVVCPPLQEGKEFGGPMAFTRAYRITEDPRDTLADERLKDLLTMDPRQCVHCSNCNLFCPKGCMPERWINLIETKLVGAELLSKKEEDFGFLGF